MARYNLVSEYLRGGRASSNIANHHADDQQGCQAGGRCPTAPAQKPFSENGSVLTAPSRAELCANFFFVLFRSFKIRNLRPHRTVQILILLRNCTAASALSQVTFELQRTHHIELSVNVSVEKFAHFFAAHRPISPVAPPSRV